MRELERLISFIDATGDHWLWTGSNDGRYGFFWLDGRQWPAHRASWVLLRGPVADDLEIDHLCGERLCVRPDHLEPVSPSENRARRRLRNLSKTECQRGHKFTDDNTYWHGGKRYCRTCKREAGRRADAKRRG